MNVTPTRGCESESPDETRLIASEFARNLPAGTVLSLVGDLGAGKTEFVKGLAIGLGVENEVTSPTFTLIHEYRGPQVTLYHIDLYRVDTPRQLETLGLDDLIADNAILLIEWGEKFPHLRQEQDMEIVLQRLGEDARKIQLTTG